MGKINLTPEAENLLSALHDYVMSMVQCNEGPVIPKSEDNIEPDSSVDPTEGDDATEEEVALEDLNLKQLKDYCTENDIEVPAKATKKSLIKLIEQAVGESENSTEEDSADGDSADEEGEPSEEEAYHAQIMEAFSGYSDDQLKELLEQCEISSKGNREALLEKVYGAVKDGTIDLTRDDEEESNDESEDQESEPEENVEEETAPEKPVKKRGGMHLVGGKKKSDDEDPLDTPKRLDAIEKFEKETRETFENDGYNMNEIRDALDSMGILSKGINDEQIIEAYMECAIKQIDDEGNIVEEGEYLVRGVPFCCGTPLEKKGGKLVCSVCGTKYPVSK